jgi:ABC-type branched-subunit amino acid transport system substrate-binding protein
MVVLVALLALTAAACGQKANVAQQVSSGGGGDGFGAGEASDLGDGGEPTSDTLAPGGSGGTSTGGGTSRGTSGGGATTGGAGGPTPGGDGGGETAAAGDRTGITDKELVIGVHAPVTGAAAFPQVAFTDNQDLYWKWQNDRGGILNGRKVRVVFEDDKFDPNSAVRVCKKMVEQDKVFLLIGGGGADQITACAKYANTVGVPYLSPGVNESGLAGLRGYFAFSQTYAQQGPLLAQMVQKHFPGKKVGIVVADTPSFLDGEAAFFNAAQAAGLNIVHRTRINKNANQAETLTKASELKGKGAEVVYYLGSPTVFFTMAQQGSTQRFNPQYIGPGLTAGLNDVAKAGCPSIGPARFFSPFPQFDVIDGLDPNYGQAHNRYNTGKQRFDIGIALWGLHKVLHAMFDAAGPDMSRQSLVATLEGGKVFETRVFPPVQYSAKNHFGGLQVHVLQADCSRVEYRTFAQFVSGF